MSTPAGFDDALLEDRDALRAAEPALRWLAGAGARLRIGASSAAAAGVLRAAFDATHRPRGVIVLGPEARLVRAVLEPQCPVPLVAWPFDSLPGWVGPLDLVVVMAGVGARPGLQGVVVEARRRGAPMLVAAAPESMVAEQAASKVTSLLPIGDADPLTTAVLVLELLHTWGLGPSVSPQTVADAVDAVAEQCSPHVDLASNPAKIVALGLADGMPLVWGGSVLAARASRRVAEALRRASGRPALAADSTDLAPLIAGVEPRHDLFADPFADDEPAQLRPVLLLLDDPSHDATARRERGELLTLAARHDVRVCELPTTIERDRPVDAYSALLLRGLFSAAYLGIGLGRGVEPPLRGVTLP